MAKATGAAYRGTCEIGGERTEVRPWDQGGVTWTSCAAHVTRRVLEILRDVDAGTGAAETLSEYVDAAGITVTAGPGVSKRDADGWDHRAYSLTIRRAGSDATMQRVTWRAGTGVDSHPSETPAEVVSALLSDASAGDETFSDFAADFGYALDSRKAYRTWEQCRAMRNRLADFLGGSAVVDHLLSLENDV